MATTTQTRAQKLAASKGKTLNVFRDAEGQPTTDADTIIACAKALLGDEYPKIEDVQALAILNSVPGDDADEEVSAAREAKLKAARPITREQALQATPTLPTLKPAGLKPMSAVPSWRAMAVRIASELDTTKEFGEQIQQAADAKEDFDGAALLIVNTLRTKFGEVRNDKGEIVRPNQMVDWPIPGSGTNAWKGKNPGANGPFDHYEIDGADGGKIKGSVYGDILDATQAGQKVTTAIRALKDMKANNCAAQPSTPKEFRALEKGGEPMVLGELRRWEARRRNPLSRLERAVKFLQAEHKLREFDKIGIVLIQEDMAAAARMPNPFKLVGKTRNDKGEIELAPHGVMSLGSFVNLKFDELAKLPPDEQTAPRLIALSRRKKDDAPTKGKAEGLTIDVHTFKQCMAAMSALSGYGEDEGAMGTFYTMMNRDGDDKNMMLDNIDGIYSWVSSLRNRYKTQIEARQREILEAQNAEAKAKMNKAA